MILLTVILIIFMFILVRIAAIYNKKMDIYMVKYLNLNEKQEQEINPDWHSFNPRAKWLNGIYGGERADNILFLKWFGWKTKWLSDNCNDDWHFCKSKMIFLLCSAIVIGWIVGALIGFISPLINTIIYTTVVAALGFSWNTMFNKYKSNTFK